MEPSIFKGLAIVQYGILLHACNTHRGGGTMHELSLLYLAV